MQGKRPVLLHLLKPSRLRLLFLSIAKLKVNLSTLLGGQIGVLSPYRPFFVGQSVQFYNWILEWLLIEVIVD